MTNDIKRDKSDSFSAESKAKRSNPATKSKPVVAKKTAQAMPKQTKAAEEKSPSRKTPPVTEQDAPFFSRRVWPD